MRQGAVALSMVLLASLIASPAVAEEPIDCPDFHIYGVAGTDAVNHELAEDDPKLLGETTLDTAQEIQRLLALDDVTVDMRGVDYPALAVPYETSVHAGLLELGDLIEAFVDDCPSSQLILVGYSQGADVVGTYAQGSIEARTPNRDRIAGVVLLGDTRFGPGDQWANTGTYDEGRAGLWWLNIRPLYEPRVVDAEADPPLDMAVVSSCRAWDAYCQFSKVYTNGLGARFLFPDRDAIVRHNPDDQYNYEHEHYRPDDVKTAACQLVTKLGYDVCASPRRSETPTDVVFLIDTTSYGFANVRELQDRAQEFVNDVSHGAPGTRYAVISYGQGNATVQTTGFTDDEADAVDAIEGLTNTGGTYGALYSAIALANGLGWREDSRRVSLTLSTSRVCPNQYCQSEYGTLTPAVELLGGNGSDARRAGAYTRNNYWLFEIAGWSRAFWGLESRLGEYLITPEDNIDGLHDVFLQALSVAADPAPIVGTQSLVAGQTGTFRADGIIPYYSDSPDRRLVWNVERTGDIGPRGSDDSGGDGGGGGVTVSRVAPASEPDRAVAGPPAARTLLEEDPEETLPEDQGPGFRPEFAEPGTYKVTVTAYLDGGEQTFEQLVRVYEAPTQPPAAPLVESYIEGDEQVFHWYAGEGEFAPVYVFLDDEGVAVDATEVETTLSAIGDGEFERRVTLADPADRYTLSAWNEVGFTPATPLLTATTSTYSHVILDDDVPAGGTLSFSGDTSIEVAALLDDEADVDADQIVSLRSPRGDAIDVDMLTATADFSGTAEWSLSMDLLGALTPDEEPVTPLLEEGFIEELLLLGSVDLSIGETPVAVVVDPGADTEQIDEFVIETNATPPTGTTASLIEIDQDAPALRLGSDDAGSLAFVVDAADPLGDWSSAAITDVRTWIGTTEVTNTLTGAAIEVTGDEDPTDAVVDFDGRVVGGSGNLTRDFLQHGTLSFVVDGGTPTVLALEMTASEAADAFPDLDPPKLVGRSTVTMTQYQERSPWSPVLSWGTGAPGEVTLSGALPRGLEWDPWQFRLTGVAEQSGTFPVTLTAHGDYGTASKDYDIVVGSPSSAPQYPLAQLWTWDYQDEDNTDLVDFEIAASGYFRPDNPAFASTLPVIDAFEQDGYVYSAVDDVEFFDLDGDPIPVAGDVVLEMRPWSGWPDDLIVRGTLNRTDSLTGAFSELLTGGGRVSFTYQGGATNTVEFTPHS